MIKQLTCVLILAAVSICGKNPAQVEVTQTIAFKIRVGDRELPEPITIGLFGKETPKTVENFFTLCTNENLEKNGKRMTFKNSIFHRVIPSFMIQGGDFTNFNGTGGASIWGEKFNDENFNVDHAPGVLSMANAGPNTNGSQFFITTASTSWLNGRHVVFGRVVSGMDTVYAVEKVGSSSGQTKEKVTVIDCYAVQSL
jgi:peptidylprolyl isomerase